MTGKPPLVSVCIANYNGMAVIDACLNSVLQQQGDVEIEILVHDDASIDASVDYIRQHYSQVRLICSTDNVGFCVANNRMAQAARGEYLLLLNNDAALFPDALQALLAEARGLDGPAILTLPQFDATSGALVDRGCLLDPFYNPVPNLDHQRQEVAMVIGACLWMPKSLWDGLGGFPEWFGSVAEDLYLCCRARLMGVAVRAVAASGYRHWQGASFGGNRPRRGKLVSSFHRRALSERNKTFVMALCSPWLVLSFLMPLHLSLLLAEGALLALIRLRWKYFTSIYLPVYGSLLRHGCRLLHLRRAIQQTRQANWRQYLATFTLTPRKLSLLKTYGWPEVK